MLQTMIDLGLPYELFLPQMDMELDAQLHREAEAKGLEQPDKAMIRNFAKSWSRTERKSRENIYEACCEYNACLNERHQLSIGDFNLKAKSMWKDQPTVQEARLDLFEKQDPRWEEFSVLGESAFNPWWTRKSDYESDSDSEANDVGPAGLALHIFGILRLGPVDADSEVEADLSDSAEE
jgi:hypothetical protein